MTRPARDFIRDDGRLIRTVYTARQAEELIADSWDLRVTCGGDCEPSWAFAEPTDDQKSLRDFRMRRSMHERYDRCCHGK